MTSSLMIEVSFGNLRNFMKVVQIFLLHRADNNSSKTFSSFSLSFLFFCQISLSSNEQKVKNIIQWKRGSSLNNLDRISLMRNDLDELKENERQLDNLIEKIKISSKRQNDCKQAYVTCQDLHNIDMYTDQMIMVVKAPPETQLILTDGDPPPVILKSEKEEIDIFFCPDPNSGGLQPATATLTSSDSDDDEASTSVRLHRKASSLTASENKRRNIGSAQRNLSKTFEDMISEPKAAKVKSNLFSAFNATVSRESSDDSANTNDDTEEDDEIMSSNHFKSTTITTKDLMLVNDPSADDQESAFGIKKDVKMSHFSPPKNIQTNGGSSWMEASEMGNFSPTYSFTHSDDPAAGFFPLEPDAGYNFLLAENEGIGDLFDY